MSISNERLHIAAIIAAGMFADSDIVRGGVQQVAEGALRYADALIKAHDEDAANLWSSLSANAAGALSTMLAREESLRALLLERKEKGATHSDIRRHLDVSPEEVEQLIMGLVDRGAIAQTTKTRGGWPLWVLSKYKEDDQ